MLIDWFTVAAQIVNFLILVWLLKHFLYGPIVRAMDRRQENIASRLDDASRRRDEADREAHTYRKRRREFEQQRSELFARAKTEVEEQRQKWLNQARDDVDNLQAKWYKRILREKDAFLRDLRRRTSSQIYSISRKALHDLAGSDVEKRIIVAFLAQIKQLPSEKREALVRSLRGQNQGIEVRSAFKISKDDKQKISDAIRDIIQEEVTIRFRTLPEMIMGMELKSHDYKVAWSLDEYLQSLEQTVAEAFETGAGEKASR